MKKIVKCLNYLQMHAQSKMKLFENLSNLLNFFRQPQGEENFGLSRNLSLKAETNQPEQYLLIVDDTRSE